MRSTRSLRVLAVIGLSTVVAASCGDSETGDAVEAEEEAIDPDAPGVREIAPNHYVAVVMAYEGGFEPQSIRVPSGATVDFRVRSVDLVHGFLIEGTDVELEAVLYDFAEDSYTFDEPGEYNFVCWIYCGGGHPTMLGKVIVE